MENVKMTISGFEVKRAILSLSVEWLSLPLRYRQKLKRELIGEPLYYSDEVLSLYIIIPVHNGNSEIGEAFIFLSEFPVSLHKKADSEIVAELEKFAKGEPTEISASCKRLDPFCNKLLSIYADIEPTDYSLW